MSSSTAGELQSPASAKMKWGKIRESVMQPPKTQRTGSCPQPQRRKSAANLTRTDSELSRATSDIKQDFARRPSLLNLEETSALAGAAGVALTRMKKKVEWDANGEKSIVEVPLTQEELEEELQRENENDDDALNPLVRVGFHRLVYQKARVTRGEYGEVERKSFRMAAGDMLHSVHICFHVLQAQRLWMSLLQGSGKKKSDVPKDQQNLFKVLSDEGSACDQDGQDDKEQELQVNGNWMDLIGDLDLEPSTRGGSKASAISRGLASRSGSKAPVISLGMTTASNSQSSTDAFTMPHTASEETNEKKACCLLEEQEQETVVGA